MSTNVWAVGVPLVSDGYMMVSVLRFNVDEATPSCCLRDVLNDRRPNLSAGIYVYRVDGDPSHHTTHGNR